MWWGNTAEASLTVPRVRMKENVPSNSVLAEILNKVYSFPSVKCTSFTQTIAHYQFLLFPKEKQDHFQRPLVIPCNPHKEQSEVRKVPWVGIFEVSPPPQLMKKNSVSASSCISGVQIRITGEGRTAHEAKSRWIGPWFAPLQGLRPFHRAILSPLGPTTHH